MNAEKHCRPNSVVVLHDSIPPDALIARRNSGDIALADMTGHRDWWAGDVWKAVLILQRARPDLRIYAFDAPPTGLIIITSLDPHNTVLERDYFALVESVTDTAPEDGSLEAYITSLIVQPTSATDSWDKLSRYFWL